MLKSPSQRGIVTPSSRQLDSAADAQLGGADSVLVEHVSDPEREVK